MTQSTFQSLAQAVEAYYEELRVFTRQRTGSASMAEEVVQEAWIRANSTNAVLPDNPRAYLYRMVSNLAIDHVRRERGRSGGVSTEHDHDHEQQAAFLDQMVSPLPDPLDSAISQQEMTVLNAAVRELPDKCREVFLLYRGHDLSMREVAARLSISEKTVEKHIARAMLHCRKRMREAGRNV